MNENFSRTLQVFLTEFSKEFNVFVEHNRDEIIELFHELNGLEDRHQSIWRKAARMGWFPSFLISYDFAKYVDKGQEQFDAYMIAETAPHTNDIRKYLVSSFPARADILNTAFDLHEQKNFIAAIPLFLSQADGICEEVLGNYLYTDLQNRRVKLKEIIDNNPEAKIPLSLLVYETQFCRDIDSSSKPIQKSKAPNRHGILHGSKLHLDYGTEINSLKSISYLSFLADVLTDRDLIL
ncbi:hypothetical protein Q4Q57_14620 [Shewanella sp. SP2S2-6]|uniref:hypothetical protein n=1 Tax=Shewanella sp. SP2S2-6 TaxID=3063540 RepID=UPI00288E7CF8|nr:hypothetical protein [Shewanella sp. SP2S2-6]MDT3296374.1 hypothetical protein [Shewanella sp. SP2S2-6]